jgi:hypothetical protein
MQRDSEHVRFLRRARWRWTGWRIIESMGVATAAAAVVGLAPVAILLWSGDAAVEPAMLLLAIGAISGAAWGAMQPPTLAQTSLRADQQLKLNDLLSTAVMAHGCFDAEFRNVVLLQADAACRERSPGEILVRRLSGRAWGAIGIVSSLLLTLSLMSGGSVGTAAATVDRAGARSREMAGDQISTPRTADAAPTRLRLSDGSAARDPAKPRQRADEDASSRDADPDRKADGLTFAPSGDQKIAVDAAGESEGRTQGSRFALPERNRIRTPSDAKPDGELPATGGGAAPAQIGQAKADLHPALGAAPALNAESWDSARAGNDEQGAKSQVPSRRIPDAYRDVVREYFSVDP